MGCYVQSFHELLWSRLCFLPHMKKGLQNFGTRVVVESTIAVIPGLSALHASAFIKF